MNGLSSALDHFCRLLAASWGLPHPPIPGPVPWTDLAALAELSAVGSILHTLAPIDGELVPDQVRRTFQRVYYRTAAANAMCLSQMAHVHDALTAVSPHILLLKGAAFAGSIYGSLALRSIGDIDLAVPQPYVHACHQALIELGYSPTEYEPRLGAQRAYRNEEALLPPEPHRVPVELHWHLLDVPYYLRKVPMDWFWQNTHPKTFDGRTYQVLTLEANLVYLPAHLALHHQFHGLHSFADLALLIHRNRDPIDWDLVIAAARSFHLATVLRETLDRLALLWPALPLTEPRRLLASPPAPPAEERLFRLLTAEPRTRTLDFYTDLVCLPDLPARARFVLLNLFPEPEYMVRRYNIRSNWELPLRYVYRLGDGLAKFTRTALQARRLG